MQEINLAGNNFTGAEYVTWFYMCDLRYGGHTGGMYSLNALQARSVMTALYAGAIPFNLLRMKAMGKAITLPEGMTLPTNFPEMDDASELDLSHIDLAGETSRHRPETSLQHV
jgi:hypothetical protein